MKSPMQLMIDQIDSVKRDDPKTALHNLKQIAEDLLSEERDMVSAAWVDGNVKGWDMTTDWREDGEKYFDEKYKNAG